LLVIHALKKANEKDRKRLLEILGMHTDDQKLRNEAIAIIKKYSSVKYATEKARTMIKEAWNGVDKLLPDSEAKKKLKAFADYLVERKI
jgi:octaprenyl-diphosphate synthase